MKFKITSLLFLVFLVVIGTGFFVDKSFGSAAKSVSTVSETPKYGLFGKIRAKDGKGVELLAILFKASKLVSKIDGCDYYIVSKDKADENSILIYEVWETKEKHANSLKSSDVRKLIDQALPLLDGPPVNIATFDVIGGKGIK